MRLYHSSNIIVPNPDTLHSRKFLDFGQGFYLTSLQDQAENYGKRFILREEDAWINTYEFNFDIDNWKVKIFECYDGEWLDFVTNCRSGNDDTDFDLIIGGIANDKVIRTIEKYFAGELSVEETLGLLKYEKPNNQYCIRSERMIEECLKHIESRKL